MERPGRRMPPAQPLAFVRRRSTSARCPPGLSPDLDDIHIEWARSTAAAIEPWAVSGGYLNSMQADEPLERVRAAFGRESFERLQTLKRRYDPNNILRRNQNIPPS